MKKAFLILALLSGGLAQAQNADPFINVLASPSTLQQGSMGLLDVTLSNQGNSEIVANSLQVTLTAGSGAEIIGFDLVNPSDSRWTMVSMSTGTNNTVVLRNNAGLSESDGGELYFQLRANAVSASSVVGGQIAYAAGANPLLGDAPSSSQGNGQTANDVSFSAMTVTPAIPLPIGLISFGGEATGCEALLHWNAAAGQTPDRYEIEAASGKEGFTAIGLVKAKQDGSGRYEFRTAQPAGKTHYRLKLVSSDGSAQYSQTAAVLVECGKTALSVFPNPAASQITVSGLVKAERLAIYDAGGRLLREAVAGGATESMDISTLPAGSYMLLVAGSRQEAIKIDVVR